MSDVKIRSAARTASGPLKNHLRSGLSSQIPTASRTAWCSATGSPKSEIQSHPSHSAKVPPMRRSTWSKAVLSSPSVATGAAGGGISISSVAAEPRSKGAAVASIGGIGTSTGMITVGVARRVSSWCPGGSTCVTPIRPRTLAGPATVLYVSTDCFSSRSMLRRRRRRRVWKPASRPGVEKIACST